MDYKVRILTGGTEAVTRVLVESRNTGTGERWFTVGVSPNIVDASFEALVELDHLQAAQGRRRSGVTDSLPQLPSFKLAPRRKASRLPATRAGSGKPPPGASSVCVRLPRST